MERQNDAGMAEGFLLEGQIELTSSGYLKYSVEEKGREAQWEIVLGLVSNA